MVGPGPTPSELNQTPNVLPVNVGTAAYINLDQQYQTIVKDAYGTMSKQYGSVQTQYEQAKMQSKAKNLSFDPLFEMADLVGLANVNKIHHFSIARRQITPAGTDAFDQSEWQARNDDFMKVWDGLYRTGAGFLNDFALPVGYFFKGGGETPRVVMLNMHRDTQNAQWQGSFTRTERSYDAQGAIQLKSINMGKETPKEIPEIHFFRPFFDPNSTQWTVYGKYLMQLQEYFKVV